MNIDKCLSLIESVKAQPCLYDPAHPDFRKQHKRNEAWIELSLNLDEDDYQQIKAKWKNLRDNYMKYLRAQEDNNDYRGRTLRRYRTWPWAEHMSFLKPFVHLNSSDEKYTEDEEKRLRPDSENSNPKENEEEMQSPASEEVTRKRKASTDQNEKELSDDQFVTFVESTNHRDILQFDETDLLFLSYAKTVKKFSPHRQALTKFKIAKVLMVAELEELKEY